MTLSSVITGTGGYVPGKPISNNDLVARGVETSDEWIRERTGIVTRHIADDGILTSDLAIAAAKEALANAKVPATDIDLIILATTTPDLTFPASAVRVQRELGCRPGIIAFDIQAVCSGFIYALATADIYLKTGMARRALVIGAETMSRVLDWSDRATCVLFGDGAGAVVLEAQENAVSQGIIGSLLHADGNHLDRLKTNGGTSQTKAAGTLLMDGKEVYRHAVNNLASVVDAILEKCQVRPEDINWLVPHQANLRIIESTAKKLGMPMDQVIVTINHHGNTSAASVPLALAEGVRSGRVKTGDLCLLEAMGAGFTWGAVLVRL